MLQAWEVSREKGLKIVFWSITVWFLVLAAELQLYFMHVNDRVHKPRDVLPIFASDRVSSHSNHYSGKMNKDQHMNAVTVQKNPKISCQGCF